MNKVSIIVPIFNVENYLDDCIKSIINQSYHNIEIILINDGSKDNSYNICKKYKSLDSRIILINQNNHGLSFSRNKGLEISTGDYILFVDSDDTLNTELIENLVPDFENLYDMICFQYSINGSMGYSYLDINDHFETCGENFLELLYKKDGLFGTVWKYCYRREFLISNKLKFYEGIIHEDEEWTPRALCSANKIIFRNVHGYNYLVRENSIMTSKKEFISSISKIKIAIQLNKFLQKNQLKNKNTLKILKRRIYSFYVRGSLFLIKNNDISQNSLIINNINILKNCSDIKHFILGIIFIYYIIKYKCKLQYQIYINKH